MRVSFALTAALTVLGFLRGKPPSHLRSIRQQLLAVENNPQRFSQLLNNHIQTMLCLNQYYEAALLIDYFKNRGSSNHAAIDAATSLVTDSSADDACKDFAEYCILGTLAFIISCMATLEFVSPKDMSEEEHLSSVGLKSILGALIVSAFLMYQRGNFLEQRSIEQKNATISELFTRAFMARFIEKFPSLFENGTAIVDSEHVRFEFPVKAANEDASDFHKLLVAQPAVAAHYIENAFGDHLVNVRPDPHGSAKIQIMVKYRSAEHCTQLVKQMSAPFFNLDSFSQAVKSTVAPHYRPGQGGPR